VAADASSDAAGEEAKTGEAKESNSAGTETPSDAGVTWVKVTETSTETEVEAEAEAEAEVETEVESS
jgi:hypothetical protein